MATESIEVTELLRLWREGDRDAENLLFETVLPHLRKLAQHFLRRERRDHTLEPTELVDTIYFKLVAAKDQDWQSRGHFYAIAARAMRRYLIDYARARTGPELVPLDTLGDSGAPARDKLEQAVMVDRLLEDLEKVNPEGCSIVELKFFLGLTDDEAADAVHMHVRKLQREWFDARRWLFERMEGIPPRNT